MQTLQVAAGTAQTPAASTGAKSRPGTAVSRWLTTRLDPRTLALWVIVINVLATTFVTRSNLFLLVPILGIALALTSPPKLTASWLGFVAAAAICHFWLPHLITNSFTVLVGFVSMWMMFFACTFAAFISAAFCLDLHRLGAVLTQMHAPNFLYVPIMVIARFFPTAMRELRAIVEAMTLRGLRPTPMQATLHPLRSSLLIIIPFLASAARVADELSAAAIIKGLGADGKRTCLILSRFTKVDAAVILILVAMVTIRLVAL
ncbi:MAG: energy-coupling factor transporter transmembrane component T [Actinomycetaceae bacterium]|nr:energy-coupling factor transporter transmembrane component T [Actinomycetaceae bacterium]